MAIFVPSGRRRLSLSTTFPSCAVDEVDGIAAGSGGDFALPDPVVASWNTGAASHLSDVITGSELTESEAVMIGHLDTVSDFRDIFEMVVGDPVIGGRVADDVRSELRTYFGDDVTTTLRVRTLRATTTGEERGPTR